MNSLFWWLIKCSHDYFQITKCCCPKLYWIPSYMSALWDKVQASKEFLLSGAFCLGYQLSEFFCTSVLMTLSHSKNDCWPDVIETWNRLSAPYIVVHVQFLWWLSWLASVVIFVQFRDTFWWGDSDVNPYIPTLKYFSLRNIKSVHLQSPCSQPILLVA